MDKLTFGPELGHITTFGGHPVSCAAAMANLEVIIEDELCDNAEDRGTQFHYLLQEHAAIKEIRRKGLMMAIELHDVQAADTLVKLFIEKGLVTDRFLFNHSAFRIAPPLIITHEQVEEISTNIIQCLDKL